MNNQHFQTPIEYLKGVGLARAEVLKKELQIYSFEDLLRHFPYKYIDRTRVYKIKDILPDMPYVQVLARVSKKELIGEKRTKRLVVQANDDTGVIELVWFQGIKWAEKMLVPGKVYIIFGKPGFFNHKAQMAHPEMEPYLPGVQQQKGNLTLQPAYNSTEKLKQFSLDSKGLQKLIAALLEQQGKDIQENLPAYILNRFKLAGRQQSYRNIHFPNDASQLKEAQYRLKFEELFFLQLKLLKNKLARTQKFKGNVFDKVGHYFNGFYHHKLPFALTNSQKRVLKEIRTDTQRGVQMNRLLQGDVGSGKTVVALMSMLIAVDNGFQTCIMAPTEILANQHYQTIKSLVGEGFVEVALLTGSVPNKARKVIHEKLENGTLNILIGTHALIEDKVQYKNLGMVVIDEQHRFGVEQRAKLWRKNVVPPHILVMTATPIPRTLAMTMYGDLDISVIDELPAGRKPIQTSHYYEAQRLRMFGFMKQEIAKGRQIYVVYPLIQESEKLDLKNLMDGTETMSREFPLPQYRISIVHGKLKAAEKDFEMQRFIKGETQIMVATTVIEVGVNVPNASVMIIENAERFGLSQLHQLRGRVGRGADQSYCILMSKEKLSNDGRIRLNTMVKTNNGFEIAETDMQLRGPGNIEGTQQSGVLDLKVADLTTDQEILQQARNCVIDIFEKDPQLAAPENQILNLAFQVNNAGLSWDKIS
ncbi:ATP-dependent DNA helicase RecG [Mucilaginibacter phyllosphaerae]|uniref:ATP-dependent DNA helicase RecG n=1 Tax=Mucilaginibacter phyllosphaerae TaxID=1812349 RepID=A0A4Y8AF27_9SPHI|nr:ATP-dependent DNA helicase RecG [Mucilaginibacter phyllosphaerae]MBB3969024.1 ATP-dependent DNA helicase RecG [Mucilaginibacter phyllosphaerae]TEW67360.1 ATP-dependent DNA helicase RecG [Mucilaginibacter phyllosphaerae]GGH23711.1 ATP-dependent DNA helicase RecG [Mucilaginibacter phyllosphaerae]